MRKTRHRLFGALLVTTLGLTACGDSDEPEAGGDETQPAGTASGELEWVDGVLQPLADGFPEDPLTIMVVDEPGSADGIYARQLQEAIEDKSPVRIDVIDRQDFTAFGTWEALQWIENERGGNEGYISMISTTPSDVVDFSLVPIQDELGVELEDRNSVISTEAVPYVIVQRKDAPWGDTLEDMIEHAKANPGELRYASRGVGAGLDIAMEHYMEVFGIIVNKIIGGPQPESAALIGAGEADISILTPDTALTHWEADRMDVIMVGGSTAIEPWPDVATAADYGVGDVPWGATRGISVTGETPDEHREWLFALFNAGAEEADFIEARSAIPGNTQGVLDHDQMMELSQTAMEVADEVVRRLGLHWEDQ